MKGNVRTKIRQISIRGYKSISHDHPLVLEMSDVNILLGPNGAGKSNIISFFNMLNYMMNGVFQKYVAHHGGSFGILHYGPKTTPRMDADIVLEDHRGTDVYKFALVAAADQKLLVTEEEIRWINPGHDDPYIRYLKPNFYESDLVSQTNRTANVIRAIMVTCKAYQFHDSSINGLLRQPSAYGGAQYLQSHGENLASYLLFLRENYLSSYKRIVSYVQMIMPSFGDFYLEPINGIVSLNWKDASVNDYVFNVDQFSDGTIRFIALATLLLSPIETMPQVIFIDEPELGLHPYAIGQLAEMIRDASLHAQITVSTQSTILIDEFSADNITIIEHDEVGNYTTAKKLNEEQLSDWLQDYTISELWTKNVIGGQPL